MKLANIQIAMPSAQYLRNSQVKDPSQTSESSRLAVRLVHTRTHLAQGEGGSGRGRGTDTPLAKSVTNTI